MITDPIFNLLDDLRKLAAQALIYLAIRITPSDGGGHMAKAALRTACDALV